MRLRQLEYFIAVADSGSVTQAAAELFIAQPSLSQQITALEREIGVQLFERLPRGTRLTPAGRAFLAEARTAVRAASRAEYAARSVERGVVGELRLATITSLAVGVIPDAAALWSRRHPDVNLRLIEFSHPDRLEEAVRVGDADLGFGPLPRGSVGEVQQLGSEECVFVLRSDDPAAQAERVDPSVLADRPWVLFSPDHGLSDLIRKVCSHWGFLPLPGVLTTQTAAAVRLAAAGLGPTIVPSNVVHFALDNAVIRPISQPVVRPLAAYSRLSMGSLERTFVSCLREATGGPGFQDSPGDQAITLE